MSGYGSYGHHPVAALLRGGAVGRRARIGFSASGAARSRTSRTKASTSVVRTGRLLPGATGGVFGHMCGAGARGRRGCASAAARARGGVCAKNGHVRAWLCQRRLSSLARDRQGPGPPSVATKTPPDPVRAALRRQLSDRRNEASTKGRCFSQPSQSSGDGGRDRDRTCDPYHVKVVQSTNSRVKSKRKGR